MLDGLKTWVNPKNGFTVLQVHYTADPAKRGADWRANAKAGMLERGWRREYEIDWAAPEGEPVIPEFDPHIHVKEFGWLRGGRVLRGWDPGFESPAVVIAQLSPHGQLRVYAEVIPFNTPLMSLIPMVKSATLDLTPDVINVFDAGDPSATRETDLGNVHKVLKEHGIVLATHRPGHSASYEDFRKRFRETIFVTGEGHQPAILIHARCKMLISALGGAFHLSHHAPYNPVRVHPYTDVVDALRYLHDNLASSNTQWKQDMSKMARSDWAWAITGVIGLGASLCS